MKTTLYRGSTPTLTFKLSIETSALTVVSIAFAQNNAVVLEKGLADCTVGDDTLSLTLTEDETLLFDSSQNMELQIRCACGDGRLCSKIVTVSVGRILKDGKLV